MYFYPRPPRGGRPGNLCTGQLWHKRFLPTPSTRRATANAPYNNKSEVFLPTPSTRRATAVFEVHKDRDLISTHALHEEGDAKNMPGMCQNHGISTHALHEEGDLVIFVPASYGTRDFYPRPPRGGRPLTPLTTTKARYFYPRPPRGGRPNSRTQNTAACLYFYPRPPRGGRRRRRSTTWKRRYFYPRPPRGGRHGQWILCCEHMDFYPRPPRGGRPANFAVFSAIACNISTHALHEEGDEQTAHRDLFKQISTHALHEEGDLPPSA